MTKPNGNDQDEVDVIDDVNDPDPDAEEGEEPPTPPLTSPASGGGTVMNFKDVHNRANAILVALADEEGRINAAMGAAACALALIRFVVSPRPRTVDEEVRLVQDTFDYIRAISQTGKAN